MYCYPCDKLTVSYNKIVGYSGAGGGGGIYIRDSSGTQLIEDNEVTGCMIGIDIYYSNTATIRNNLVKGNGVGMYIHGSSTQARVIGNEIIENDGGISGMPGTAVITGNIVMSNGGGTDIALNSAGANISHNIYNTFGGSGAVGMYNVKADGTPAPLQ